MWYTVGLDAQRITYKHRVRKLISNDKLQFPLGDRSNQQLCCRQSCDQHMAHMDFLARLTLYRKREQSILGCQASQGYLSTTKRPSSRHLNPATPYFTLNIAMTEAEEILDLYDIAVLLNYERNTTEPNLRHTKLREVAFPGSKPKTVALPGDLTGHWNNNARTWFVVEAQPPSNPNARDLPLEFLHPDLRSGSNLSNEQLETFFHQARNHDGSYQAIRLLQFLFDLFPEFTKLRVRHAPSGTQPGHTYVTNINRRVIIEESFRNPKVSTAIYAFPAGKLHVNGHQNQLDHAVFGFSREDSETVTTFFDLSSMQFGDLGRGPGPKGKQLFALDTPEEFALRFSQLAKGTDPTKHKTTLDINPTPVDDWLEEVAIRTKRRWDNRHKENWCGHCGAPGPDSRCAGCRQAYYCGKECQRKAWTFHKGYCSPP